MTMSHSQESDPLFKIFGSGRISQSENESQLSYTDERTGPGECGIRTASQGSVDLFSSHGTSQGSLFDQELDITLQLTENIWVQCDNPDCQKWRRIPARFADSLDDQSWYCHMNPDRNMNTCSATEEDHAKYDRMARKAGIKFVMSLLNEGCLVWAKMAGYCKWPAVITRDPEVGVHVLIDIDGDPTTYHIEFLGNPHSHSWVAAKHVQVYGHKNLEDIDGSQSQSQPHYQRPGKGRGRGGRRCGRSHAPLCTSSNNKLRKSYKRIHIEDVMEEADFLLGLAPEERLRYTTFKYDPLKMVEEHDTEPKRKSSSSCDKCGQHTRRKRKHKHKTGYEETTTEQSRLLAMKTATFSHSQNSQHIRTKRSHLIEKKQRKKPGKENLPVNPPGAGEYDFLSDGEISQDEGISVPTIRTASIGGFESPEQFSQSKLRFLNTMTDKTKEEKFTMDIDMYKKNEKAFEHDVYRFMSRHGRQIRSVLVWHNIPVRMFQVYLAVHERGGFNMVSKKKQWTAVFKELTEQQNSPNGVPVKKYYERNLYPYELYMGGKDYMACFTAQDSSNLKPAKKTKKNNSTGKHGQTQGGVHATGIIGEKRGDNSGGKSGHLSAPVLDEHNIEVASWEKTAEKNDNESLGKGIEEIMGQLAKEYNVEKSANKDKHFESLGLGLRYHDQSTPSQPSGKVLSEFQPPSFSDGTSQSQEVPEIFLPDSTVPSVSDGDGLSDVENKILHEMNALEDDMRQIAGDLDL